MPTTCATSVLGVCGWALAPRTAHPRVGSALGSFTWGQCSAVSGCAAHYHTLEQPQSLSTRRTCVPRGRGSTARPITPTHGPEDSTSRNAVPARAIPAPLHAPHSVSWPHTDNPNPRHDGHERDVQAGWGRCGRTVRGDCPRSRGRCMGLISTKAYDPGFIPPLKDTSSTRPRAARIALWRRRAVRAPVGDAAAPFRRGTGSMDATCASCRSPVGPAGS